MPDRPVLVMNLGINGALPQDLLRLSGLVASCRVDLLVMDVGMRAFSSDFAAADAQWSRSWLAHMSYDDAGRFVLADNATPPAPAMDSAVTSGFWTTRPCTARGTCCNTVSSTVSHGSWPASCARP